MKYYIYKIENIINHKVYVGLTNNIPRRWGRHLSGLRRGVHDNKFLQSEFNKYGESNFEFGQVICGDYTYEYSKLLKEDKDKIAELFSNE